MKLPYSDGAGEKQWNTLIALDQRSSFGAKIKFHDKRFFSHECKPGKKSSDH